MLLSLETTQKSQLEVSQVSPAANHYNDHSQMKQLIISLVALAACTAVLADEPQAIQLTRCNAPIASVMVGKLTCKSAGCGAGGAGASAQNNPIAAMLAMAGQVGAGPVTGLGDGIRDMFVTVLQQTGCVEMQDREAMDEIADELRRAGKEVKVQQADYLISGALTTVEMENSKAGFGGGFIPIIGSISKNTQKATVGMDLKLVDVNTAKVIETNRYTANSETSSFGIGGGGFGMIGGGVAGFGGSLSSLKGTSLEIVAREAAVKAANGVVAGLQRAKSAGAAVAK